MAKLSKRKQKSVAAAAAALQSDTAPFLELKYGAPLFAIAAHPTKPIIASGLANGYVFVTQYNPTKLSVYSYDTKKQVEALDSKKEEEKSTKKQKFWKVESISKEELPDEQYISHLWKTKRHKGSVRSICFNAEGTEIYTVGSDNVIKKADAETGKVIKKVEIEDSESLKVTKILKSITHPILVLGDEDGNVRVFNSDTLKQTNLIQGVHEDAVNSIIQLQHKSAYQFLSVGSTTLSVWDTRKDKPIITSENQEDEMLSCTFVDPTDGNTLICGMGEGLITIWKRSKNNFEDQLSRVKVSKDESIDSIISTLNNDDCIWAGSSNGTISKINCKKGAVVETRIHSNTDEVTFLDIDYEYRLISAGMDKLKIWNTADEEEEDDGEEFSDSDDSDDSDDSADSEEEKSAPNEEDWEDIGSASENENVEEEQEEQEELESKGKKNSLDSDDEETSQKDSKNKKQKLNTKQLKNLQNHEHGIRRFDDL